MRYIKTLTLALALGAGASAYACAASAGVYVGVGIAPPVVAVPGVRIAPFYYAPAFSAYGPGAWRGWYGPHYIGPRGYWGHRYSYRR
jgi:hypothetical protein